MRARATFRRLEAGVVALAALMLSLPATAAHAATALPAGFTESTIVAGFDKPVGVSWAPDGRMFVAEKNGRVRVVSAAGVLRSTPLLDLRTAVNSYSDRGMLGIATDADFATNHYLYLLYVQELLPATPDTDAPMTSKLTRVTVNADNTLVNASAPETVILGADGATPCPAGDNTRDCIPADYKWHTIGTVRSDPTDGTLWVGNGDAHAQNVADATTHRPQDETSLAGKIMHIDRNGRGLPGHPFCADDTDLTHTCTKLYAKGFRNPYRFQIRPGKGPIVGDVGSSYQEEVDAVQPGKSYGWPCYEGTQQNTYYKNEPTCVAEYAKGPAAHELPVYAYPHGDGASVAVGPIYAGNDYPADYRGDIFVGDYVQGWVKRLRLDANDRFVSVTAFATAVPSAVDLAATPAGELAYVDIGFNNTYASPNAVRRFTYTTPANPAPTPVAAASPSSGPAPLAVQFDGTGSVSPAGAPLTYDWDFGDGSPHSSAVSPRHTYTAVGNYVARLTVDDGTNRNPSTTVSIGVGANAVPVPTMSSPTEGFRYRAGERVTLQGSATDAEDGTVPASGLRWSVLLHHGTHVHDVNTFEGVSTAAFDTAVDHDADSYYEIRLSATDSNNATATAVREVRPQAVAVSFASSPAGAPISYAGGGETPAPSIHAAAVGFHASMAAADSFDSSGVTYVFDHWSDGGARQHDFVVGASDVTYTATYRALNTADTDLLVFTPTADTFVDASLPTTSYGSGSSLEVDASPVKQAFLRFQVAGLSGRRVVSATLRLVQKDSSPVGGRVFGMSSTTWAETVAWNTRPAVDGAQVAAFGAVATPNTYEAPLTTGAVRGDGALSLAITSPSTDSSKWSSRQTALPPQLVVQVERTPGFVLDGTSELSSAYEGSTAPTSYATNHRLALSASGRQLTVHGRATGVQLSWRDAGGGWRTQSTGASANGQLATASGSATWPASIAVARGAGGSQSAWVVWTAASSSSLRPVQMRRLSNVDSPSGPTIGPIVTVDAPAAGAYRADVAAERLPDGSDRVALLWSRRVNTTTTSGTTSSYDTVLAWLSDVTADAPTIVARRTLYTSTSSARYGSLVPTSAGMRMVARSPGNLRLFSHAVGAPLDTWVAGATGAVISSTSSPTAVALSGGEVVAAAESDTTNHVVTVQRFTAAGTGVVTLLSATGYREPSVASDGTRVWLVMVRLSDGAIVSREQSAAGWTGDRVELAGAAGYAWPSVMRDASGRLRIIVRGPAVGTKYPTVAYQRTS
jgi:glucose/arabinose dehydrogenase